METLDAIRARKSVRAYLDKDVPNDVIRQLVSLAACAPSGANSQPWQVSILRGRTKQELEQRMTEQFEAGIEANQDYDYYPTKWFDPYQTRRVNCGHQLYSALSVERGDRERRRQQWIANYGGFGAPIVMIFTLHKDLAIGSYMDTAMFIQTLMLAAVDMGLATCPEAALASYPDIMRDLLGLGEEEVVLCGLALGYEDSSAPVNQYRTPRESPDNFTRWYS